MKAATPFRQRLKIDWWSAAIEIDQWRVQSLSTEEFRVECERNGIGLSTAYALLQVRNRYSEKPKGSWRKLLAS